MSSQSFDTTERDIVATLMQQASHPQTCVANPQERGLYELNGGHVYAYGMCVFYAVCNKLEVYKEKQLRIVIGSFGVGMTHEPFWEHGDPRYTSSKDFIQKDGRTTDLHMWLEDAKGCIYDILSNELAVIACIRDLKIDKLKSNPEMIEGVCKKTLAARGFHYLAASADIQQELWTHLLKIHVSSYKQLEVLQHLPAKLN
jgi:hypothetical protein